MICLVPPIDVPLELLEVNSSSSLEDTPAHLSRRRRDTTREDSTSWSLLNRLWNFVRTLWHWDSQPLPLRRQKRAPVSFVSNMNVSLSLYLGFIMDKYTSLRNISKTKPNLRLELIPFHFECDNTPVTFDPAVNPLIKIKVM